MHLERENPKNEECSVSKSSFMIIKSMKYILLENGPMIWAKNGSISVQARPFSSSRKVLHLGKDICLYIACSSFTLANIGFALANLFAKAKDGFTAVKLSLANCFVAATIFLRLGEPSLQTVGGSSCLDFCPFLCLTFFQCLQKMNE